MLYAKNKWNSSRCYFRRTAILIAVCLLAMATFPAFTISARAQMAPVSPQMAPGEPSIQAKIAQLKDAKERLARQARETNGYHESLRQMKIVKIDKLMSRLKNGENVPQKEINHTIEHMAIPGYMAPLN